MAAGLSGGERKSTIGVSTALGEMQSPRERQVLRAEKILRTRVEKDHGSRPFAYIQFHVVPKQNVTLTRDDFLGEIKAVTVQHSSIFPPGEV